LQLLGGDQNRVPGPVVGLLRRLCVWREHRLQIEARVLLEQVQPRTRRLGLRFHAPGARMSWPDPACASATTIITSLLPSEVM
jgi:hypothetical protein